MAQRNTVKTIPTASLLHRVSQSSWFYLVKLLILTSKRNTVKAISTNFRASPCLPVSVVLA